MGFARVGAGILVALALAPAAQAADGTLGQTVTVKTVVPTNDNSYDPAFYGGAALCVVAAVLSLSIRRRTTPPGAPHSDDEIELSSVM